MEIKDTKLLSIIIKSAIINSQLLTTYTKITIIIKSAIIHRQLLSTDTKIMIYYY